MNKKSQYESKDSNVQKKPDSRRNHTVRRNLEEQYKRIRNTELEKEDRQVWKDNKVVYIEGKIYIPNNWKI